MRIARFTRAEFLAERWHYRYGEHVSLIGPTQQAGKTRMMFDLLGSTDTTGLRVPPVVAVTKPKDLTIARHTAELGFEEIKKWPPKRKWLSEKSPGYVLWPPHMKDAPVEVNNAHLVSELEPAMNECFWGGNSVFVCNEVFQVCALLHMEGLCTRHWTQGMGMGSALWCETQKPSGTQQGTIPTFMYNSTTHMFLGRDNVAQNRKRFGEIGGVDPKLVEETTMTLRPYEFLYIHRAGPTMCVVEAA